MDLNNYIMPELLVGVPLLIIIGKIIKDTQRIKNRYIPLILGIIGIVFATAWTFIMSCDPNIPHAIMVGFTQGVLIAGMAVYGNQIFKQIKTKGDNNNGE